MDKLVYKGTASPEKIGASDSGSLVKRLSAEVAQRKAAAMEIKKITENVIILADCSGSMGDYVGEMTKWEAMRKAVSGFKSRLVSFNFKVYDGAFLRPNGGTAMHKGFEYIKKHLGQVSSVLVISDGLPDYEDLAMESAKSLGCRIDIIYIGPGNDDGEKFMQRLAGITGGQQTTVKTYQNILAGSFPKQLTESVKEILMIGEGK